MYSFTNGFHCAISDNDSVIIEFIQNAPDFETDDDVSLEITVSKIIMNRQTVEALIDNLGQLLTLNLDSD